MNIYYITLLNCDVVNYERRLLVLFFVVKRRFFVYYQRARALVFLKISYLVPVPDTVPISMQHMNL